MGKISYYIKRLSSMNYKGMFETINKVHKRSNKPKISIFFDMINSSIKYGAGYTDYFLFNFENLNHDQKKTFITRTINNNYIKTLNNSTYYHFFWDKVEFNNKFKDLLNRDFLDLENSSKEEFKEFIKKHKVFMAKPIRATGGLKVEKIKIDSKTNTNQLYDKLINNNQKLIEEYVIQNKEMNKLCEASVNTLRIVTVRKNHKTTVMLRAIRIGNGINAVDNFHSGGMYTLFDENGVITKPAADREGTVFEKHPFTNTKFVGFKIPYYKEAINMAIKASERIEEVGLVGWDVAISENGPVMIEGNELAGYDIYQSKIHLDDDSKGLKPLFDKVIYGDNND